MTRLIAALVVIALTLLAASDAAPVPKSRPQLYHPTKVGAKRVYRSDSGRTSVHTVTRVEERDGVVLVTEATGPEGGRLRFAHTHAVSADGVILVAGQGGKKVEPPRVVLELPARAGDQWVYVGRPKRWILCTVKGVERVGVPAGVFEAVRVESEYWTGWRKVATETSWYAPGVGAVKHFETGSRGKGDWEQVLVSFDPGK